nr:hypothetical protein Iba_scaffold35670CG0020 [Ipomoea batatas]
MFLNDLRSFCLSTCSIMSARPAENIRTGTFLSSRSSKNSTTPSLKAMLAFATEFLIAPYVRPPSMRRSCVFPHLQNMSFVFSSSGIAGLNSKG